MRKICWNGIRKLPFGFAFLAVCFSLGKLFERGIIPGTPEWLAITLSQSMAIVGRVALTVPAQRVLFDPLPLRRDNFTLRTIMETPFKIQPRQ